MADALDSATKKKLKSYVDSDVQKDLGVKYGLPSSGGDPLMALGKKYGMGKSINDVGAGLPSTDSPAAEPPPAEVPTSTPAPAGSINGSINPLAAALAGGDATSFAGADQPVFAKMPNIGKLGALAANPPPDVGGGPAGPAPNPGDVAAMNAIGAKMGNANPFANSALQPGVPMPNGTPGNMPSPAAMAAPGSEFKPVYSPNALVNNAAAAGATSKFDAAGKLPGYTKIDPKTGQKIAVDSTGKPYPASMQPGGSTPMVMNPATGAMVPANAAGVGGGVGMKGPASPIAQKTVNAFDKYLSPAERGEIAHQLDFMQKSGKLDQAILDSSLEGKGHVATLLRNYQDETEVEQAAWEAKETTFKKELDDKMAVEEKMAEDAKNTKIDEGRWWADKGTGGQIAATIGVILSGVGAGINGGPNVALQQINSSIDRDLAVQKENLSSKYKALAAHQGLLGQRVQAFGDERAAYYSAKAAYGEQIQRQIQSYAATTDNETAKVTAEKLSVGLDGEIQQYKDNVAKLVEQRATAAANAASAAAAANAKEIRERNKKLYDANLEVAKKFLGDLGNQGTITLQKEGPNAGLPVVTDLNGKVVWSGGGGNDKAGVNTYAGMNEKTEPMYAPAGGSALNPRLAGKFAGEQADLVADKEKFARLRQLLAEKGKEAWGPAKEEAKAIAAELQKKGYGVPDDPLEREFTSPLSDPNWTKIDVAEKSVDDKMDAIKKGYLKKGAGPNPLALGKPVDEGDEDSGEE